MIRHWPALLRNRFLNQTRQVGEHQIHIPPGVMDPVLFKTGLWFAQRMRRHWQAGEDVLDLGCGAGLLGVLAQADGLRVTATDSSPQACLAARRNGIDDVRQGDLFEPVLDKRFDHICFNPPYYRKVRWYTPFKTALVGSNLLMEKLLQTAPFFLKPNGKLWIATGRGAEWLWPKLEALQRNHQIDIVDSEELCLWQFQAQAGSF